jgi:hypothetical protein
MMREQVEEIKRHFDIAVQGSRNDMRQVTEGHAVIRHEMQEFRNEVREGFREVRDDLTSVTL